MGRKLLAAAYGAAIGTIVGLTMATDIVIRITPARASNPAIYIDEDRADAVRRHT